ncbi:hypothetical protein QBC46DRAFT_356757 [Diplogelasinospora grovesii]|uniref:Uncharacterized protein n=1 Tax=Diplogelasinospora grovesii TaxID=303347 RepID=A0AAN6N1B3_9PEZI|nr:hypothetical protein QBC46DRAFT_356757 [Diplogelasinospora grovesii]
MATPSQRTYPNDTNNFELEKRATSSRLTTCGYLDGDPTKPRTANAGFDCRVDTKNALWGFCTTTVTAATDCNLAGSCVDNHQCPSGCGFTDQTELPTCTCEQTNFCSTALLTVGVDQTYSFIACGAGPSTDHYMITPTAVSATSTSSSPSQSPSLISPSSKPSSSGQTTTSNQPLLPASTVVSSAQTSTTSPSEGGSGNNTGAIIRGVIGGLALICGSAIAAIYILRRYNNNRPKLPTPYQPEQQQASEDEHKPPVFPQTHHVNGGWGPQEMPTTRQHTSWRVPQSPVEMAG